MDSVLNKEKKDSLAGHSEECRCSDGTGEEIISLKNSMPPNDTLIDLAEFFKVFGDPTRVRIIYALANVEMCVCDIASLLEMEQSAISHQLRKLKQARLVKQRREGKSIFYSLNDEHVKRIFDMGLEHVEE
ncbi:MAG: helix-turn-helix transcriptional regulator [bacterium]|nr:helix-turn-helix transcriptional regulator [bacterium]